MNDSVGGGGGGVENLENLLSPICYGREIALPTPAPGCTFVPKGARFKGCVAQDCQWGCVYNNSVVQCFPVDRRVLDGESLRGCEILAICDHAYQFPGNSYITCVAELKIHNQRVRKGISKLLVGLNMGHVEGSLVIFDPLTAKVLKWIRLPKPVTSVIVISHYEEGGGANRPFSNESMMAMVGIAAVGMVGGEVYIVDLGLDDDNLSYFHGHGPAADSPFMGKNDGAQRHYYPVLVEPHEHFIAVKRHKAVARNELITLAVTNETEEDEDSAYYKYCKPNGESMMSFPKGSVEITCLEYIPCIGSIVVGFGFGCFQIWRVDHLSLIFSSIPPEDGVGEEIFGFSFTQPVDDPKNFCYLWVLYGSRSFELKEAHVELHCLVFKEKILIENLGFIYNELKQCVKRLTFRLEDYFEEGGDGEDEDSRYQVRPLRVWAEPDKNLTFFGWESRRNGVYYVGIFDLNQWYSNHTLDLIRYNPMTGLCPYWVAIPVEAVDSMSTLYDVRIIPKTLERWINPHAKLDMHLYPASLSFRGVALASTGVSTFQHFGIQEKLIRKMISDGPSLMIHPGNVKQLFKRYGLQPVYFSSRSDDSVSVDEADRFFIFSVLQENRKIPLIIQLAAAWLDGSYANFGCTIDLILNWIGIYTVGIRQMAWDHWNRVFSFRNEVLPPETSIFINYSNYMWSSFQGVLETLTKSDEVYNARPEYIESMKYGLNKLVQFSAGLLMMHRAGYLPEKDEKDVIAILNRKYVDRRAKVKEALNNCETLDPTMKKIRPLMIDYLLEAFDEEMLREKWHLEPEEDLYPPKHIGYLLQMFLWVHEDPKAISRVVAYFLLDLSAPAGGADDNGEHGECDTTLRGDFQSVIQLTPDELHEVFNLWMVDQGSMHNPLVFLAQANRFYDSDVLPWCAAVVAFTALGFGEDVLEILQRHCPRRLDKLYMQLMINHESRYGMLSNHVCAKKILHSEVALYTFFDASAKKGLLGEFINTTLRFAPPIIKSELLRYLKNNRSFENDDRLLAVYTQDEDYDKIEHQYKIMKDLYAGKLSGIQLRNWTIREGLVLYILKTKRTNVVMKFLKLGAFKSSTETQIRPAVEVERIEPLPQPPVPPKVNLPIQLKAVKAKVLESVSSVPLSPMRRYVGRLHAVIDACEKRRSIRNRPSMLDRSMGWGRRSEGFDLSTSTIQSGSDEDTEDEPSAHRSNLRSFVDLESLLELPLVDHRNQSSFGFNTPRASQGRGRGGSDEDERNSERERSIYQTPSAASTRGFSEEPRVQSIMKKEDSVQRNRENIALRFLDTRSMSISPSKSETELNETFDELPEKITTRSLSISPSKFETNEIFDELPEKITTRSLSISPSKSEAKSNEIFDELPEKITTRSLSISPSKSETKSNETFDELPEKIPTRSLSISPSKSETKSNETFDELKEKIPTRSLSISPSKFETVSNETFYELPEKIPTRSLCISPSKSETELNETFDEMEENIPTRSLSISPSKSEAKSNEIFDELPEKITTRSLSISPSKSEVKSNETFDELAEKIPTRSLSISPSKSEVKSNETFDELPEKIPTRSLSISPSKSETETNETFDGLKEKIPTRSLSISPSKSEAKSIEIFDELPEKITTRSLSMSPSKSEAKSIEIFDELPEKITTRSLSISPSKSETKSNETFDELPEKIPTRSLSISPSKSETKSNETFDELPEKIPTRSLSISPSKSETKSNETFDELPEKITTRSLSISPSKSETKSNEIFDELPERITTRSMSRSPSNSKTIDFSTVEVSEKNIVEGKRRRRAASKLSSMFKWQESDSDDEDEPQRSQTPEKITTRSSSRSPSCSKTAETPTAPQTIAPARRKKRKVFDFQPEMSTIIEDPSGHIDDSVDMFDATQMSFRKRTRRGAAAVSAVPPEIRIQAQAKRSRRKKAEQESVVIEEDEEEHTEMVEEKVKPRKRRKSELELLNETLQLQAEDDNDDARSDVSGRSGRSNRSTSSVSGKKRRTRKT